jgi:MinD-like ATPase involved in chromosome partitioning or flagellar assembly/energy-coupling factor transporter ATP-binding protein EcfA2
MIVTFYSYKGGVGRTQLLVNLASYFCYEEGKKILIVDWDLEAPGIHHYFENTNNNQNGLIELFNSYVKLISKGQNVNKNNIEFINEDFISVNISKNNSNKIGRIDFIPSANYSKGIKYVSSTINAFNWRQFYDELDGANYLELFKQKLKSLNYDYILIDSRTGLSDYLGICNVQLPELNVILVAPTNQNFTGALEICAGIKNSTYVIKGNRKPLILPILSRIDLSIEKKSNQWINRFKSEFKEYISYITNIPTNSRQHKLFKDYCEYTLLDYKRDLSFGEEVLFSQNQSDIGFGTLSEQYKNIGKLLNIFRESALKQWSSKLVKKQIRPQDIFEPFNPVSKYEYLVGRNELTSEICSSVFTPNSPIILFGERGSGKTSIAKYLFNILKDDNTKLEFDDTLKKVHPVWLTCSNLLITISDLIMELIRPSSNPDSLSSLFPDIFTEYKKQKILTKYEINLGITKLRYESDKVASKDIDKRIIFSFFNEILYKIDAAHPDSSLVFFIDDFDLINDRSEAFELIRSYNKAKFVFIATGNSIEDLFPNYDSVSRSFMGNIYKVSLLNEFDISTYFKTIENKYNYQVSFSNNYVKDIFKYSSGYPFLMQLLSFNSFKHAQNEKLGETVFVDSEHLKKALDDILEKSHFAGGTIIRSLLDSDSKTIINILRILAKVDDNLISKDRLKKLLPVMTTRFIDSSLDKLVNQGIIIKESQRYRFKDPVQKLITKLLDESFD